MPSKTQSQIISVMRKNGDVSVRDLGKKLNISPQMLHRHLKALVEMGVVVKLGAAPKTTYRYLSQPLISKELAQQLKICAEILSCHPAVKLITLFGSQARGDAKEDSDIDLLVWISSDKECFNRHDIWNYFDRHSRDLPWKDKVSLVVRKLAQPIFIETLLLDLPEEHRLVYDSGALFDRLRKAIISWREKWGSKPLPSFGGKHGWIYSTRIQNLKDIDFRLEIEDVA